MRVVHAEELRSLCKQGLIIRDQFRPGNCEGITYSLTLGSRVQSISRTEPRYRQIEGTLVLAPGEAVNVEINEKFNFADENGVPRYFGIILAGARLLAGGVLHPATLIDPGFRHTTTLTLINLRNFPSRAFRPGSDTIAKLIVVEFAKDEIPPGWEETPAYRQSGPDDLPVLWADFHMMPEWSPTRGATVSALEQVYESFGPPFDVLAAHIFEHRRLLSDREGGGILLSNVLGALREEDSRIERMLDFLTRRVEAIERDQTEIDVKAGTALSGLGELKDERLAERDRSLRDRAEGRRYWITTVVAVLAAIVGAVVTIVLSHFWLH
jgi:hypothetical protein